MHYKTLSLLLLTATALAAPEARPEAAPEAVPEGAPEASPENLDKRQSDYYSSLMNELDSMTDINWEQYLTNTDWVGMATSNNDDFGGFATNTAVRNAPTNTQMGGIPTDFGNIGSFSMPPVPTLSYAGMPPPSIASVLITAVPSSYMAELANPSARSSLIHEIQQGHYPDWYSKLPNSVKQWISTNYASMTAAAATATGNSGSSGSGSGSNGSGSQGSASSSSSHGAAPAATGAIAASLAGAAGILGLALAL